MVKLAALLLALVVLACTEPTPEGPPENGAPECHFPSPEVLCPGCTGKPGNTFANGKLRSLSLDRLDDAGVNQDGVLVDLYYYPTGALVKIDYDGATTGCYPDTGRMAFRQPYGALEPTECWDHDAVQYECHNIPAEWEEFYTCVGKCE